jgi:adenylylsulfate kinase-like enzyme
LTGIDYPNERPEHTEVNIDTTMMAAENAADVEQLRSMGILAWV